MIQTAVSHIYMAYIYISNIYTVCQFENFPPLVSLNWQIISKIAGDTSNLYSRGRMLTYKLDRPPELPPKNLKWERGPRVRHHFEGLFILYILLCYFLNLSAALPSYASYNIAKLNFCNYLCDALLNL